MYNETRSEINNEKDANDTFVIRLLVFTLLCHNKLSNQAI